MPTRGGSSFQEQIKKSCVDRHHASSSQTFREPRCPRLSPSTQAWLHFGNGWGIIDASGRSLYDADLHALAGSSVARGLSDGLNRELDGSQVRTAVICFCPQLFCTARTARVLRNATARGAAQGHPLRELNLSQCLSILLDQARGNSPARTGLEAVFAKFWPFLAGNGW